MVKIRRLYIENFTILKEVMGKDKMEISFSDNPLCIIIGKNGSGKSFLMSWISPTPFDLVKNRSVNPAIPDKTGIKEIDLELDAKYIYKIKIIYEKKTSCFIHKYNRYTNEDLGELNPNGNVTSYYDVLEKELGFTKSYINIGYLSDNVTNIISMKPAERSSYISVWLPQLNEFIDAYKVVSKKANIINRQVNMLNADIGKLSDTDYDVLITNYTTNIAELENSYHEYLKMQSKTQAYLNILKPITRDVLVSKIDMFKNKVKLLNQERIEIMDARALLSKYSGKNGKKLMEETINKCTNDLAILGTKISNIDSNLSSIESEMNEINSNNQEIDESTFLSIESTIEHLKSELESLNKTKDDILKEKPEYSEVDNIDKSEIDIFRSFMDDLKELRNKITSLVDSSYLKDNEYLNSSNDKIIQLKETYEKNLDKLEADILSVSNKIYLLKNSDMSYMLKFKPTDCTRTCGIVQELMKYADPRTEIDKTQKLLDGLIIEKTELNNKIIKLSDESHNMLLALESINEMNHKIFNRKDLISKMPSDIRTLFENPDICVILTSIPTLLDKTDDYKEYIYLNEKIDTTAKSLETSSITFNLLKQRKSINDKWLKLHEKYEEMNKTRRLLIDEFTQTENKEKQLKALNELNERSNAQIEEYNSKADLLITEKKTLKELSKNYYLYNSFKESDRKLEICIYQTKSDLDGLKSKIEIIKNKKNSMMTLIENRDNLLRKKKRYDILSDVWSPKIGYPALQMEEWLDDLTIQTNSDLEKMWGSELKIEQFKIGADEFNISINRNGEIIEDASECSAGERSTLSLAISFAVIEINLRYRKYNILRFDELDGPFDADRRKSFIDVLNNRMADLDCGSAFIISHNNEFGDTPADAILLSETEEKADFINKTIVYSAKK